MMPSARLKTRPKPETAQNSWTFDAIGTHWWIGIFEPIDRTQLGVLKTLIAQRIEAFDSTYSRFRPDSLITQASKKAGTYVLPPDSGRLFSFYKELYDITDGAITPLIGDMLIAAGYDAHYTLRPKTLHPALPWERAIVYKDGVLTVTHPVMLDFGAAGKGYLVDLVAELIKDQGIERFCVDAGGDMITSGLERFAVGLEHPDNLEQVLGVARLTNQGIAGSAVNRRTWGQYHHVLDPRKLASAAGIKAVWVTANSALLADGLATALFFVAPERLGQFDFEYLNINDDNHYKCSAGFPAELF